MGPGIRHVLTNRNIYQLTSSACAPSFIIKRLEKHNQAVGCNYSNEKANELINLRSLSTVVLAMSKKHELIDWEETIRVLKEKGVNKVIIIGPVPQWKPSLPKVYVKRHMGSEFINDARFDYSLLKTNNIMKTRMKNIEGVVYVDLINALCKVEIEELLCKAKIGQALLVFDYGHLTTEGAIFVAENLLEEYL